MQVPTTTPRTLIESLLLGHSPTEASYFSAILTAILILGHDLSSLLLSYHSGPALGAVHLVTGLTRLVRDSRPTSRTNTFPSKT